MNFAAPPRPANSGPSGDPGIRRAIRRSSYAVLFGLFACVMVWSHLWLLRLPYYWDEAGQFIPSAVDLFRHGWWISRSVPPIVHPPGVMAYLAAAWTIGGFHPEVTRLAMLLAAAGGLLAAFLLAIELSREARGTPGFWAAALLFAAPVFFAQSILAQLDMPAMALTALALLLFVQERVRAAAAVSVALVLVKETGVIEPLLFAGWLAWERRWREAAWFLLPVGALAGWIGILRHATGEWAGSAEFLRYNVLEPLHPVRLAVTAARRIYFLLFANFHWIGTLAILYAWRNTGLFRQRSWRVAWALVAAYAVMLTVLGGAVLNRYLLPVLPVLFAAMASSLSFLRRVPRLTLSFLLLAGMAACNWINPPYPFPFEENLAFADFVHLESDAADYVAHWYPGSTVASAWPMTAALARPDLGFVRRPVAVETLADFTKASLKGVDWRKVDVLVVFSRAWDPQWSLMRVPAIRGLWRRFYGYAEDADGPEAREIVEMPIAAHFERGGQWADVYVRAGVR
jgi:4-amino-4-deoxy-L-arabinose transferase-like glycosyltransferase